MNILQRLKELRAKTHQISIHAVEMELDRIVAQLERPSPFPSYTLTSLDLRIGWEKENYDRP